MSYQNNDLAYNTTNILLKYVEKNNYKGFDPYDLKGLNWYIDLANSKDLNSKNFINKVNDLNFLYPKQLRDIFKIKPKTNNKALALFAISYINLFQITNDKKYLTKSKHLTKKLLKRANKEYSGLCWGYPFDWKSGDYLFKKNTPSIVVTFSVGKLFLLLYKLTKRDKYLSICKSIMNFILKDLNQTKKGEYICFSYTPHDNYQIHNANLMAAEFLCEYGSIVNSKDILQIAKKSAYFTISQQNEDGSIYYYGNDSVKIAATHLDIYHSGFEIRSLISIYKLTKDDNIKKSYLKYLEFFKEQYILKGGIPKLGPKVKNYSTDIVDVHGLAEAILTLSETSSFDKQSKQLLNDVLTWGLKNMRHNEGWFIFR
jgi:rhamnogalacturonyl hydrolase YesR